MLKQRAGVLRGSDRKAFEVLGLTQDPDTYDVLAVDSRWRELRSQLHPDKPGGDAAKFDEARKAYVAARFYALEPKPCPDCDGKGRVIRQLQTRGFQTPAPVTVNCGTCKGSGHK